MTGKRFKVKVNSLIALYFMMEDTEMDNRKFVLTNLYHMTKIGFTRHKELAEYVSLYIKLPNGRNPFLEDRRKAYATAHFIGFVFGMLYDELPRGYTLGNEDMKTVRQGIELAKSERLSSDA